MRKKIKGHKKLSRKLSKVFFTYTGYNLHFVFDSDFFCMYDDEELHYTLLLTEKQDENFTKFVAEKFNVALRDTTDLFIFSILHEIGHFDTIDRIPQTDINYSIDQKFLLAQKKEYSTEDYQTYFSLPVEYVASRYAANLMKYDKTGLFTLKREVILALDQFYRKNV